MGGTKRFLHGDETKICGHTNTHALHNHHRYEKDAPSIEMPYHPDFAVAVGGGRTFTTGQHGGGVVGEGRIGVGVLAVSSTAVGHRSLLPKPHI